MEFATGTDSGIFGLSGQGGRIVELHYESSLKYCRQDMSKCGECQLWDNAIAASLCTEFPEPGNLFRISNDYYYRLRS